MKAIKYVIVILVILTIGIWLGWFFNDIYEFAKGVQEDTKRNSHVYRQSNDSIITAEFSNQDYINNRINFKALEGIYEYVYEYNSDGLIENHYLEFKNKKGFYYGTSDDFDEAREGYYPGFFITEIDDLEIDKNKMSFNLKVNDSIFYRDPITPLQKANINKRWNIGIRYDSRNYKGIIKGDTIIITTKDFDSRKFIKYKTDKS